MKIFTLAAFLVGSLTFAQSPTVTKAATDVVNSSSTSTDVFFMFGSDFDRPGLIPRANYNVGIGHTFDFITKTTFGKIFGDEPTVSYTYENGGSHGFWHTSPGGNTNTESIGLMKNFTLPKVNSKKVTFYGWPQIGITSILGGKRIDNRMYSGYAVGGIIHLPNNLSIWLQESFNKIVSVPYYTTTSVGFTVSF